MKKTKTIRAYADIGSHNGIFEFVGGKIADNYPTLLQVYRKKVSSDLIPVKITYLLKTKPTPKRKVKEK